MQRGIDIIDNGQLIVDNFSNLQIFIIHFSIGLVPRNQSVWQADVPPGHWFTGSTVKLASLA